MHGEGVSHHHRSEVTTMISLKSTARYQLTILDRPDGFTRCGTPDELVTALRDDWNERAYQLKQTKLLYGSNAEFIRHTLSILTASSGIAPLAWPLLPASPISFLNFMSALRLIAIEAAPSEIPEPV